jgi:hypothetical protein
MTPDIDAIPGLKQLWAETLGHPDICLAFLDGTIDQTYPGLLSARLTRLDTLVTKSGNRGPAAQRGGRGQRPAGRLVERICPQRSAGRDRSGVVEPGGCRCIGRTHHWPATEWGANCAAVLGHGGESLVHRRDAAKRGCSQGAGLRPDLARACTGNARAARNATGQGAPGVGGSSGAVARGRACGDQACFGVYTTPGMVYWSCRNQKAGSYPSGTTGSVGNGPCDDNVQVKSPTWNRFGFGDTSLGWCNLA